MRSPRRTARPATDRHNRRASHDALHSWVFRRVQSVGVLPRPRAVRPVRVRRPVRQGAGRSGRCRPPCSSASSAAPACCRVIGFGSLVRRFGSFRLYRACYVIHGVSFVIWLVAGSSYAMLVLFVLVLGVGYGGFVALGPIVISDRMGVAGLGSILGLLYTAPGPGCADRGPDGRLADRPHRYLPLGDPGVHRRLRRVGHAAGRPADDRRRPPRPRRRRPRLTRPAPP